MFSLLANDESDNENQTEKTQEKTTEQDITEEKVVVQKEFEVNKRDKKNYYNRHERHDIRYERSENKYDTTSMASMASMASMSSISDNIQNVKNVQNVFRDDKLLENKIIYDENKNYGDIGNDKKLNSYWTVWVHKNNCNDWTLQGYQKIYVINSIGSFWRFFNNFQLLNTYQNQIFIMREEIAPIWEDVNNKFGGICSVKIDSIQKGMKTDLSTEILVLILLLIMNETFVANSKNLNGISYSVKKRSSLIKLWIRTFTEGHDFIKDLPVPLINKFNTEMQKQSKNVLNNDGKISIQYKQIKPEFE
jgi:hypothetical protein